MTGDIPPAALAGYICTTLAVSMRAPKQQRWQRGSLAKNQWGEPVPLWFPVAGPAPPHSSWHECELPDIHGVFHRYIYRARRRRHGSLGGDAAVQRIDFGMGRMHRLV